MAGVIPTSALEVAESIILEGERLGVCDMTARKLQKLIYFSQVYHLALHGRKAFSDSLKAWQDGPVVPSVWHEFKAGRSPEQPVTGNDLADPEKSAATLAADGPLRETVQKVLGDFGRYPQDRLVEMTHGQRPWVRAWENSQSGGSDRIADDDIAALAQKLARYLTRQFQPTFRNEIEKLYQTPGDVQFVLGKMALASAAGELSEVLLLGSQEEEVAALRQKMQEAIERIASGLGPGRPGFVFREKGDLDRFAVELTEFAMDHRVR